MTCRCFMCERKRGWRHIIGRIAMVLMFLAFMFGPVLLRLAHAWRWF